MTNRADANKALSDQSALDGSPRSITPSNQVSRTLKPILDLTVLKDELPDVGVSSVNNEVGDVVISGGNNITVTEDAGAITIGGNSLAWVDADDDYTVQGDEVRININTDSKAMVIQLKGIGNYPDVWNGINIKNSGKKIVTVKKSNGDELVVVPSGSYFSVYYSYVNSVFEYVDLGGTQSSGIIELDATNDFEFDIDPEYAGKTVVVTSTATPAQFAVLTVVPWGEFENGSRVTLARADAYGLPNFVVNYKNKVGQPFQKIVSSTLTLQRTADGWIVVSDTSNNQIGIISNPSQRAINIETLTNVDGFLYVEHPAIQIVEAPVNGGPEVKKVLLVDLTKTENPTTNTVDVVGWWTDSAQPNSGDILSAMAQVQSDTLVSHSDNIRSNELPTTVISMIREETSAKYTYFAYPEGFFTNSSGDILEPAMVNTGIGNSSDWLLTVVEVDGINYRVHRSPSLNLAGDLMTCKLVQEGYR